MPRSTPMAYLGSRWPSCVLTPWQKWHYQQHGCMRYVLSQNNGDVSIASLSYRIGWQTQSEDCPIVYRRRARSPPTRLVCRATRALFITQSRPCLLVFIYMHIAPVCVCLWVLAPVCVRAPAWWYFCFLGPEMKHIVCHFHICLSVCEPFL